MKLNIKKILQQAIDAHKQGKNIDAEHLYNKILNTLPKHPDACHNLGLLMISNKKLGVAIPLLKMAIEVNPNIEQFWISYINVLISQKHFKKAEVTCRKAIETNANFIIINNNLGNLLKELDRLEEAETSYKKAIELNPNFAIAHYNLGNLLKELDRLEEAETSYKKAIELKPNYAEAHANLGGILKELDRLEEAETSYKKAIELKPTYENALMAKGQMLFDKGDFELSLKDFNACNNEDSRARSLASLYALGKTNEIYHQIKEHAEVDDQNIRVAAFSAFISHKEKKKTAHKFCNNPMDFIYFSKISSHLKNPNFFITEVIEELRDVKTRWEPLGRSTRNGFHSGNKINLFKSPLKKIHKLQSIILDEIDKYQLKFKNKSCSYIKKWPTNKKLFGWHVILKKGGYQTAHIHPSGWLSGVIYLKVVLPSDKNEGAIEFDLNGRNYYDINSQKLKFQPNVGDIIFFPSSLHHRTLPFTKNTERIIISFDLIPDQKKTLNNQIY